MTFGLNLSGFYDDDLNDAIYDYGYDANDRFFEFFDLNDDFDGFFEFFGLNDDFFSSSSHLNASHLFATFSMSFPI